MEILVVFKDNLFKFDWIIIVLAVLNTVLYAKVKINTDRLYKHYNSSDKLSNLREEALQKLAKNTKEENKLSPDDLLDVREKMNKAYAGYSNFTTMFPLFGMLGTVWALIPIFILLVQQIHQISFLL